MKSPWRSLAQWTKRARPPLRALFLAIASGTIAHLTGIALFVGAPYLLFYSSSHHQLVAGGTLAILLIGIELLAFLRSPLRFAERMCSHELGLESVTSWRRWLTVTIGTWPYRRWSAASTGDLLERALSDTDTLQDLWLRAVIPVVTMTTALFMADILVGIIVRSLPCAAVLLATQTVLLLLMGAQLSRLVIAEGNVRHSRARRTAVRIELQSVAAELELLGRLSVTEDRLRYASEDVAQVERQRDRQFRLVRLIGNVGALASVGCVAPVAFSQKLGAGAQIAVLLLAFGVVELLAITRMGLSVVASVNAAVERLDSLEHDAPFGRDAWPDSTMIDAESLTWLLGERVLLNGASLTLAPGRRVAITGPSGSGKSTLLRMLARLEEFPNDTVSIGGIDINDIDEAILRRHLAYVSASPSLLNGIVERVIRVGRISGDDVVQALGKLGLRATSTTRWEQLSRGEAQRAALVRGLLDEPKVVLLDEPTSGLGPEERDLVLARLDEQSGTIIIATHDEKVIAWCDETFDILDGKLRPITR